MKVLVFVSKWIGRKCIDTLFTRFNNDDYLFVVSDPDADKIIELINNNNHQFMYQNSATIDYLNSKDNHHYDWLLNLWGGYIFDQHLLLKAKNSLNVHPSFLPFGKGRDPVVWAVRDKEPAGVTLHQITSGVDEGPIIYQEEVRYDFPITGGELYERVVERCWIVFNEQWPRIRQFKFEPKDQKENNNTHKRKDLLKDQLINLDDDNMSRDLLMRINAHDFGDDYCSNLQYKNKIYSIRLMIKEKRGSDV